MGMLADKTLRDLLDAFSSPDPTPGGGSAAAMTGALGAALLAMVAGLPKTKHGTPEERAALDAARADLLRLQGALVELIDRDAAAYDQVVAAYRQPKTSDAEKATRAAAIQAALREATEAPLATARACAAAVRAGRVVAEFGNPSARSDVGVGVQALLTALQGAFFNIEANIGSLKDAGAVEAITRDTRTLAGELAAGVRHIYEQGGVADLMRQAAQRLGTMHGAPPDPSDPAHAERLASMVVDVLGRLQSSEARQALDAFARSADEKIAGRAKDVLNRSGG
jgi:methenyltetrahydrofolate cyclohydrolase